MSSIKWAVVSFAEACLLGMLFRTTVFNESNDPLQLLAFLVVSSPLFILASYIDNVVGEERVLYGTLVTIALLMGLALGLEWLKMLGLGCFVVVSVLYGVFLPIIKILDWRLKRLEMNARRPSMQVETSLMAPQA